MNDKEIRTNSYKNFENVKKKISDIIQYKNIITIDNLKKGLAKTKSNVAPDLDGKIKANFTEKKLEALHKSLKSQKFQPTPIKKVNIPKPDGGTRSLGVASQKDKVVQAAILIQLEPVLENIFLNCSYGGRLNKNCHHALKSIKTKWQNVTWIIHIDIKKYFDTINHDLLLNILTEYCDQATIELIRKFLKCGYIDLYNHPNTLEKSEIRTPPSSLISPILSNLYLHPFDRFMVEELLPMWNRGNERKYVPGYQTRKNLTAEEKRVVEKLKHNKWVLQRSPFRDSNDDNFRRMYYARYGDDLSSGFTGTRAATEEIKRSIKAFLLDELKLKTNETKSYICHSSDKNIKYLGYFIRYIFNNKILKDPNVSFEDGEGKNYQLKSTAINQAQLRIPTESILRRAVDRGYGKIRKRGTIRPTSCRKLSSLDDELIVQRFSSIIRGLIEFYAPANKRSDLWQIVAFYRKSCALTLADKHKLKTAAAVYKRYGPILKVSNPIKKKETVLLYPTTLKTTCNFKLEKANVSLSDKILDPIQRSYKQNVKT